MQIYKGNYSKSLTFFWNLHQIQGCIGGRQRRFKENINERADAMLETSSSFYERAMVDATFFFKHTEKCFNGYTQRAMNLFSAIGRHKTAIWSMHKKALSGIDWVCFLSANCSVSGMNSATVWEPACLSEFVRARKPLVLSFTEW